MMTACRNPECVKGLAPGVITVGKGSKGAPLIVAGSKAASITMRWAWVRCLACNANADDRKSGVSYKHIERTADEIARRVELANAKAPYKFEPPTANKVFDKIRAQTSQAPVSAPYTQVTNQGAVDKLLEQISQLNSTVMKLTNQVGDLLEENRALRKQIEGRPADSTAVASTPAVS